MFTADRYKLTAVAQYTNNNCIDNTVVQKFAFVAQYTSSKSFIIIIS